MEKLTISKEGAWFTGNQAARPGVPGRGAAGVRELLWAPRGAAGRLPGSSAPLWAPILHLFGQNLAPEESFAQKSCRVRGRVRVLIAYFEFEFEVQRLSYQV